MDLFLQFSQFLDMQLLYIFGCKKASKWSSSKSFLNFGSSLVQKLEKMEKKDNNGQIWGNSKTSGNRDQDPEKHGVNMGLKTMSDFRKLYFINTMHNVTCCLKVCLLTQ